MGQFMMVSHADTFWRREVSVLCKKFMLGISQPSWPTSRMCVMDLQGREVVALDF